MKPLEEIFFRACLNEQIRKFHIEDKEFDVRTIGNIFDRLGFSYKQLMYYVRKWSDKGFYNYNTSLDLGWFELDKLTGEYKKICEEVSSVDSWNDGELAEYIVRKTFSDTWITNYALKRALRIGEDFEFFNQPGVKYNEHGRINGIDNR